MNDKQTGYEPGKGDAYDYVPHWMTVPRLYTTDGESDPLVVVKLFTPWSSWTWHVIEHDPDDGTAFGLVEGLETEMGYFSISELREVNGPFGLRIERDLWFAPKPLSQVRAGGTR